MQEYWAGRSVCLLEGEIRGAPPSTRRRADK
jgi:hypothetical protein